MFWEQVFSGLVMGSFYSLIALGFVLVFKSTEVLNFAQGDLMMLAPFMTVALIASGVPFAAAVLVAIALTAFVGFLMERIFIRHMVGQSLFAIVLATLAMSIILRSIAGIVWGHELRSFPQIFSNAPFIMRGVAVSPSQLWVIGISVGLVVCFYLFFQMSKWGIAFRAAAENQLVTFKLQ